MKRRTCCQAIVTTTVGLGRLAWAAPQPPQRLVSVHGSLTEIVYRLHAQNCLVGTDTTSTHPQAAQHTTKVGYMRQLSAEGLLALHPTALLGTDEAGPPIVLTQLRQAGVPVQLVPATHNFEELQAKIQAVAQATGQVPAGHALSADLSGQWAATQARAGRVQAQRSSRRAQPLRVLFVMAHGGAPMTAGQGTAAHAMITLAGGHNALPHVQGYRPLTAESVAQTRPDVVLTTTESLQASGSADRFWQHPGLAFTPAARQSRLIDLDAMALLGFGPRLPVVLDDLISRLT